MNQGEKIPEYSRQDLRKATKFVEGDYSGINPRRFYRQLKRGVEEIQEGNDFKYDTRGDQSVDLEISSEAVGEKTGVIKGRLIANSDWFKIGTGILEYKPYGPHGALGIVVGLILLILGLDSASIAGLGLVLIGGGAYGYLQTERDDYPIIRQDALRVLLSGEVSERTVDSQTESRTDIFANMSVVYAGNLFVAVDSYNLEELNWNLRRQLLNQVKRWHNQVVRTEREEVKVEDGFIWNLKAWANKSIDEDRRMLDRIQSTILNGPFEYRLAYTGLLKNELPPEIRELLDHHENELMIELEELADDLDVYVEREGLQHTDKIQRRQEQSNPRLEPGDN